LAFSQGTCWLRVADTPEKLQPKLARVRERGIRVCLRLGLICRPTREEAVNAAESLLPEDRQENTTRLKDDSQMYREGAAVAKMHTGRTPNRSGPGWVHHGPVWTTLLGSPG
jgi:alkanesulfonate monooxygenase SsuD/methylene tetrahydromethanopterin reductase-like flavin-dependent oxidoreductase (luciferase family)